MPFQKGVSGNPGGRTASGHIREIAKKHADRAIEVLVELMESPKTAPSSKITAATEILNRAYGKPAQALAGADGEGPIQIVSKDQRDAAVAAAFRADT